MISVAGKYRPEIRVMTRNCGVFSIFYLWWVFWTNVVPSSNGAGKRARDLKYKWVIFITRLPGVLRDTSFSEVYWWRGILILILQKYGQNILLWEHLGNLSQFSLDLAKFQPAQRNSDNTFPNVSQKVRFLALKIIFQLKKFSKI